MGKDGGRGQITRLQPFGSRHRAPFSPFPSFFMLTGWRLSELHASKTGEKLLLQRRAGSGCFNSTECSRANHLQRVPEICSQTPNSEQIFSKK